MTSSWLQRKRKGDLIALAQKTHLSDVDGLLKDDLVQTLQEHLEANGTRYGKLPEFSDFYKRSSPVKREPVSPDGVTIAVPKPRRRQTKVFETSPELYVASEPTPEKFKTIVTRTPRTVSNTVSRVAAQVDLPKVDLPASPAQVADLADQSFQAAKEKAEELWKRTYIEETIEIIRERASSVTAVECFVLLIEAAGLQWNTLKVEHAFNTPALFGLNTHHVRLPDYTKLLTSDFWAPATLWSLTSLFIPLLFSYFFNLTLRSNTKHKSSRGTYAADPLIFNITKAILQYSVYAAAQDLTAILHPSWGPFSWSTRANIARHAPGGYHGLQIGAAIGILVSIYDAALKK
ncbi:hypothetical protein GQ43DRAFT_373235 [Delitschia confertaspora ATCC 74209]|uniref:Uncharacterized protein n=1 Tax=Delitschia confertaspora ATCC 74209 TaxID=1513339 RepID=A0A9P4MY99_9PLEO|nr:hypothetical protein GQ43DRAFT_373235 [Delitschia confertaspora ATCC 74209]